MTDAALRAFPVGMTAADSRTTPSDAEIVGRVLAGDTEAYATIVARYHGRCRRHAQRMLRNGADAEDVVQETFVRAYDALGRYEERQRFASWLFTILVNECRAALQRRARRERWVVVDEAALRDAPHGAAEPDAADVLDQVEAALERLEPLLREAFLLRHVEGLDYAEMQAVTGAGLSALKMRVKRACEALRAHLQGASDD